jgi:hypothetical protein
MPRTSWIAFFEEKDSRYIVWYGESEQEVMLAQKIFRSKKLRAVKAAESLIEKLNYQIYNGTYYEPKKLKWSITNGIAT